MLLLLSILPTLLLRWVLWGLALSTEILSAYGAESHAIHHGQGNQRRKILKTESMKFEGGIVVDIAVGAVADIVVDNQFQAVEVAVEGVCCILATLHNAMGFAHIVFVDGVADKEAVERAAAVLDSRGAGIKRLCILDLLRRDLVSESWMDTAVDSLVAGNDSPPWLTMII